MNLSFANNEDCAAASDAAITSFEQELGLTLPTDYRKFLLISPGGAPNLCWSSFNLGHGDFVKFVFGLHRGAEWKRLTHAINELGHDRSAFLPVAVSNGGNYFLLRLTEPDVGAVYFWDHELAHSRRPLSPPSFAFRIRSKRG